MILSRLLLLTLAGIFALGVWFIPPSEIKDYWTATTNIGRLFLFVLSASSTLLLGITFIKNKSFVKKLLIAKVDGTLDEDATLLSLWLSLFYSLFMYVGIVYMSQASFDICTSLIENNYGLLGYAFGLVMVAGFAIGIIKKKWNIALVLGLIALSARLAMEIIIGRYSLEDAVLLMLSNIEALITIAILGLGTIILIFRKSVMTTEK